MSTQGRQPEDFRDEIAAHIEHEAERLIAEGLPPEAAWATARRRFGNTTQARERFHESSRWIWLDDLVRDFVQAARNLRRNPGFAATAILSLALGIGANVAAFSLVDAILLKTLPVRDPEQLRIVNFYRVENGPLRSHSGFVGPDDNGRTTGSSFSYNGFLALQRAEEFESIFGFSGAGLAVTVGDATDAAKGQFVSGSYFSGLGIVPFRGRMLDASDDSSAAPGVAMITQRFWQRRFGKDPDVVGHTIQVNRQPVTIVGILPPTFEGLVIGGSQDIFLPLTQLPKFNSQNFFDNQRWWIQVFGRLRPGVSDRAGISGIGIGGTDRYVRAQRATH